METSFGNWIKRRRKALDLTQEELAQRVGCSKSAIFKIEADERRPSRQIAELLAIHLEIPPDQRSLFLKVARQEKATDNIDTILPLSKPDLATFSDPYITNLPAPPNAMIGREFELAEITRLIQDPQCRLLTLIGPGGIGKTRLSLEAARQLQEKFADGVYFVPFAGVGSPEHILSGLANAIGFSFSGPSEPEMQLIHFLRQKKMLLVLDNLEHLLDGVSILSEILQQVPKLKFLTTSREPLRLQTEWTFEVQGLPVPQDHEVEELETSSAARLFLQRARQARVGSNLTADDRKAVLQICRLVQGLPLGIELAAAWVRTLSCQEIAQEIGRSINFLVASSRDVPERHRSIKAVFDHSWELLSPEEQRILQKLTVFRGRFTRQAADQVAGATLPLLSALVDQSLVQRNDTGHYNLHELLRQYAAMRLGEDRNIETSTRDRHARYYLELWRKSEVPLKGSKQREALRELIREIDNFRSAWERAIDQSHFEVLSESLHTFLIVYDFRGWHTEAIERLQSLISPLNSARNQYPGTLGFAFTLEGWFHFRRGYYKEARERFEQGLSILRAHNDPLALADVLTLFSPVLTNLGEKDKAKQYIHEAVTIARASGETWRVAHTLMMQGGILGGFGRYDEAYASSLEALAHFRALGDSRHIAVTLNTLGYACLVLSRFSEAENYLQESLNLIDPAEDAWSAGTAYGILGIVELSQERFPEALTSLQKSISLFDDLGMQGDVAYYLTYLGEATAELGANHQAEEHWLNAIRIAQEAQALPTLLASLIRLARLHANRGDLPRAYAAAILASQHPASWQETKDKADKLCAELRPKLSDVELGSHPFTVSEDSLDLFIQQLFAERD